MNDKGKIKQIIMSYSGETVYGLGENGKLYELDYGANGKTWYLVTDTFSDQPKPERTNEGEYGSITCIKCGVEIKIPSSFSEIEQIGGFYNTEAGAVCGNCHDYPSKNDK